MEILINELSLTAQYNSIEHFIENGINVILPLFKELSNEDLVFKTYNFYENKVTQDKTIHELLVGPSSRTHDELRKFKLYLSHFFEDPYWEDSPRHSLDIKYQYKAMSLSGTSLAEACERDKVIISFSHPNFIDNTLNVLKENDTIVIDNLFEQNHYKTLKINRGLIQIFSLNDTVRFSRTNLIRQGQTVYQEINTGYFWYLDALHKNHYEVFNSNEDHIGVADLEGNLNRILAINGRRL
jgi:hypothetical protein